MLTLKTSTEGHDMIIKEYGDSGVHGLDFQCKTCQAGDQFDMMQYPKYRLAMKAAVETACKHADVDALVFSL